MIIYVLAAFTICLAAAIARLVSRFYRQAAPFPGIPFPAHLHRPIIGAAEHMGTIEGLHAVCVAPANQEGFSSFLLVGAPVLSVLKAEHIRKVSYTSYFQLQSVSYQ